MKTKSKIVLLLAGAAMSATAAVAYAQTAGGNQQTPPGMQNCEQGTPGQGPCGEGMVCAARWQVPGTLAVVLNFEGP